MTLASNSFAYWVLRTAILVIATTPIHCLASSDLESTLLSNTVRIQYERSEGGALITGHGTAFGVDLSQYGFSGRRYLLSAAHNVLDDNKQPYATLKVEIQEGTRTYWSRCKVAAFDADLDLCIVEAGDELNSVLQLASSDPPVGSVVAMAGSPRGVPVALFQGVLSQKFDRGSVRSIARIPFDHGDSGGPIVCPKTLKVIGVAVAGVPKNEDLDHDLGLYVPVVAITSFLEANRKGEAITRPIVSIAPAPPPNQAPFLSEASSVGPAPIRAVAEGKQAVCPSSTQTAAPVAACRSQLGTNMETATPAHHGSTLRPEPALQFVAPESLPAVSDTLKPTQTLVSAAKTDATVHVVQQGENLHKIAQLYGVTISTLINANNLKNPDLLAISQKLSIPNKQ